MRLSVSAAAGTGTLVLRRWVGGQVQPPGRAALAARRLRHAARRSGSAVGYACLGDRRAGPSGDAHQRVPPQPCTGRDWRSSERLSLGEWIGYNWGDVPIGYQAALGSSRLETCVFTGVGL